MKRCKLYYKRESVLANKVLVSSCYPLFIALTTLTWTKHYELYKLKEHLRT